MAQIKFANFKAFGPNLQTFTKKPITLIYGPNSIGKSSLIHAMIYKDEIFKKNFNPSKLNIGDSIFLGGFGGFIHKKNPKNKIIFELSDKNFHISIEVGRADNSVHPLPLKIQYTINDIILAEMTLLENQNYEVLVNSEHPSLKAKIDAIKNNGSWNEDDFNVALGSSQFIKYMLKKDNFLFIGSEFFETMLGREFVNFDTVNENIKLRNLKITTWTPEFEKNGLTIHDVAKLASLQINPDLFDGKSRDEVIKLINEIYDDKESIENLSKLTFDMPVEKFVFDRTEKLSLKLFITQFALEYTFKLNSHFQNQHKIFYIGPLRHYPSIDDAFKEKEFSKEFSSVQFWSELKDDEAQKNKLNEWLSSKKLNTPYEITVSEIIDTKLVPDFQELNGNEQEIYKSIEKKTPNAIARFVSFIDKRNNTKVHNREMGLGVTQVLPIIGAMTSFSNRTIAIEQPELHLHPALQCEIADEIIKSYKTNDNHFMIETHSEHLLLRIMKRMRQTAEGKLDQDELSLTPDDICLLYIDNDGESTYLQEMRLSPKGTLLDHWPNGFFEEGYKERFS